MRDNFTRQDLGITEDEWQQTPPGVRTAVGALYTELAKIKEQLNLNSATSSQPPSRDKPHDQREKKGKPGAKDTIASQ